MSGAHRTTLQQNCMTNERTNDSSVAEKLTKIPQGSATYFDIQTTAGLSTGSATPLGRILGRLFTGYCQQETTLSPSPHFSEKID